ncbi:hypothetical protein AZ16_0946 [Bordetella bronchiseptica B18-5 (C3)]|nr:hypothetical protein AZ16_0946 [Bordetella bronchiseptica B18-5 (C3)]
MGNRQVPGPAVGAERVFRHVKASTRTLLLAVRANRPAGQAPVAQRGRPAG